MPAQCRSDASRSRQPAASGRDGVRHGSPVVLVHGAFNTSSDYRAVGALLARDHRVVLVDRRAYATAASTISTGSFRQDGEDIAAVLQALAAPALLFGHSAGAIAALHAARLASEAVTRLVLYEPAGAAPAALLERFRSLRETADDAAALAAFMAAAGGPPEDELAASLREPQWASRLSLVGGVQSDLTAQVAYSDAHSWTDLTMPIHILVGEHTHGPVRHRAEQLAEQLPHAQIQSLAGQGHLANMLAPEQLAQTLDALSNGEKHR